MKNRLLICGLALILIVPLTIVLQNFARDVIVVPLLFITWFVKLLLWGISQSYLWAIFLLLPLVFFFKSLKKPSAHPRAMEKTPKNVSGTVSVWANRLRNAEKGIHYERSLRRHLGKLFFLMLAYNTGRRPEQIRKSMESGDLEVPSAIQAYLKTGDDEIPPTHFISRFRPLFRSWTGKGKPNSFKKDLEKVVKFLEDLLKVNHER